eukprot:2150474-Heterocapsa_arctica.AAC.1
MRSGFIFFMRGDIRDTAAHFENMHFMDPIVGGLHQGGNGRTFQRAPYRDCWIMWKVYLAWA